MGILRKLYRRQRRYRDDEFAIAQSFRMTAATGYWFPKDFNRGGRVAKRNSVSCQLRRKYLSYSQFGRENCHSAR
jgi:hypothetical protein